MTAPWFIAINRFCPAQAERWAKYLERSKLVQLEELVSLDTILCPPVLNEIRDDYWPHIVNEDYCLRYFKDLEFLRRELASVKDTDARLLCVYRNPPLPPNLPQELGSFQFLGFDLVDPGTHTSVLCHFDGWTEFDNSELSKFGLIADHSRAIQIQKDLEQNHPTDAHAWCDVWAIFSENE